MAARSLRRWGTAAVLLAGACAAPPAAPPPAAPPPPAPVITPPPPQRPAEAAPPRPTDSCGASDLQYLIGRPRTEIPIPLAPNRRRVVCSTCPVTQDFLPYRQTITYDSSTGLVTSIRCG